ncbi:MAG TPA: hypothetical protein VGE22_11065 [Solimonas sp.]
MSNLPAVADALAYSRNFARANPRLSSITVEHLEGLCDLLEQVEADRLAAVAKATGLEERFAAINTPEIADFLKAVENEALHQRDRWGADGDAGKADADWFWLIGYLAGKALHKPEKVLHHIITTAAACLNWHAAKLGVHNRMRPGHEDGIYSAGTAKAGQ